MAQEELERQKFERAKLELEQLRAMGHCGFYIAAGHETTLPLHDAASKIAAGARGMWGRRIWEMERIRVDQVTAASSALPW